MDTSWDFMLMLFAIMFGDSFDLPEDKEVTKQMMRDKAKKQNKELDEETINSVVDRLYMMYE